MKIETEEEYIKACQSLRFLTGTSWNPGNAAEKQINMLSIAISDYDNIHHKTPDLNPIELLKYFMENNNMTLNDIGDIIDIQNLPITLNYVQGILDYKLRLPEKFAILLANFFKVRKDAFTRNYDLIIDDEPEILIGDPTGDNKWDEEKLNKIKAFMEERTAKHTPEQKLEMEFLSLKYGIIDLIDKYKDEINWRQENLDRNSDSLGKHYRIRQETSIMNLEDHINDLKKIIEK